MAAGTSQFDMAQATGVPTMSKTLSEPCYFLEKLPQELRDKVYNYTMEEKKMRFKLARRANDESESTIETAGVLIEFPFFPQTTMFRISQQIASEYASRVRSLGCDNEVVITAEDEWDDQAVQTRLQEFPDLAVAHGLLSTVLRCRVRVHPGLRDNVISSYAVRIIPCLSDVQDLTVEDWDFHTAGPEENTWQELYNFESSYQKPTGTINRILRVLRAINRGEESVAFERVSEWDEVEQKMVSRDEAATLKHIGSP